MPAKDFNTTLVIAPIEPRAAIAVQPALSLWKHKQPFGSISVIANRRVAAIFSVMAEVSEVIPVPDGLLGTAGKIALLKQLRTRNFSHSFQLATGTRATALGAMLSIKQRHQPNASWLVETYANGDTVALSWQFAALMLGLPERVKSPADLPIQLPAPTLRSDAIWQRQALERMGVTSEFAGEQALRPQNPLFVLYGGTAALLSHAIGLSIKNRWPSASVVLICNPRTVVALGLPIPSADDPITRLGAPSMSDSLALIASATALISADEFAIQASAAFLTPVVSIPDTGARPLHSGRARLSSLLPKDIVSNLERVLRFDGSSGNIEKLS